ncbi:hypothetical protein HYU93_03105 [Candidatus Daviesbacteria bacterium]|nr:hypothetical protein [Candidatus Daviesbacteria bacterium]
MIPLQLDYSEYNKDTKGGEEKMVGEGEPREIRLTEEQMKAKIGEHMAKVAAGQEGENPFKAYIPPTRVPFAGRVVRRVMSLLKRGNQ